MVRHEAKNHNNIKPSEWDEFYSMMLLWLRFLAPLGSATTGILSVKSSRYTKWDSRWDNVCSPSALYLSFRIALVAFFFRSAELV